MIADTNMIADSSLASRTIPVTIAQAMGDGGTTDDGVKIHPAALLFPMMGDSEYAELVEDIRKNGQRVSITYWKEMLLDGRNRHKACLELGIEPDAEELDEELMPDPTGWVLSNNLHRRHLSTSQRSLVAAKVREIYDRDAKERQVRKPADSVVEMLPQQNGKSRDKAGEALGVSGRSVDKASKVLASGDEDLVARVERGEMSVNAAVKVVDPPKQKPVAKSAVMQDEYEDVPDDEDDDRRESDSPELASTMERDSRPHVSRNSGDNEWYTPQRFIDAARATMGVIDLDPASSETANAVVGAARFFTEDDNGLSKEWSGNVWMNPPYAQPLISQFAEKLVSSPGVGAYCILVNNATETKWFQAIAADASAVCFPSSRVKFWSPGKVSAPLQGQAILYRGDAVEDFAKHFGGFGLIFPSRDVVNQIARRAS